MDIFTVLHSAKSKGASDLHLVVSSPPLMRIDGSLQPADDMSPLTDEDINQAFHQLTSDKEREDFHHRLELDFSYTIPDVVQLRCNVAKKRGTISIVIRLLPLVIPTLDELELTVSCKEVILKHRGVGVTS